MSVQLDHVDTLSISTSWWTSCICYKYNAATPGVCIHHFKLSRPAALDLYVSKEFIQQEMTPHFNSSLLHSISLFKDKIASKLFQSLSLSMMLAL